VLRVFDALVAQGSALNLVIAGVRQDDAAHIRAQVNGYAWRERVRLLPFYGEDQMMNLAAVYAGASVYLDLSLHEGFGMQVIEAMACGTPVVCSNRGALPEVTGKAAMLVEPTKEEETIKAILSIISNRDLCQRLVILGFDQAMQFNWLNTAEQVLDGLHFSLEKRR